MIYIGIDPGKSGAIAIIKSGDVMLSPFSEDIYKDWLYDISKSGEKSFCVLEKVGAMPGQGVTSMFNFGTNFGYIQGLLKAYEVPFELVTPQKWKKEYSVTSDKNTSVAVAKRIFPDVNLKKSDRCKKDDDGLAEALLMAEYARRHMAREV